jgi:hypothetical protein
MQARVETSSGSYVEDPDWLPHAYDPRNDTLTFAHVPRETQRQIVFLDRRFIGRDRQSVPVQVSALSAETVNRRAGPLHFIFHTGFCCSTLLARALDIPGVSMGVKEPSILASFAQHWTSPRRASAAMEALTMTLNLLSRPLVAGEVQVVKPSTVVNHIAPQLLFARPDAKAIVLFSSLDTFLRAIARRGMDGRVFARELFYQFAPVIPLDSSLDDEDSLLLADLQIAAQAWLMQASFLNALAQRMGPGRVRILNADTLLKKPRATLSSVGAFFNLNMTPELARAIAEGPVFKEHAKELGRPFSAEAQRAQYNEIGAAHLDELMVTKNWARDVARRAGVSIYLDETLPV